jgi:hypothetical protein
MPLGCHRPYWWHHAFCHCTDDVTVYVCSLTACLSGASSLTITNQKNCMSHHGSECCASFSIGSTSLYHGRGLRLVAESMVQRALCIGPTPLTIRCVIPTTAPSVAHYCRPCGTRYGARFRQKFTLEDAIERHAFAPLEALACV